MKPAIKGQSQTATSGLFSRISPRLRLIIGAILIVLCTVLAFSVTPPPGASQSKSLFAWLFEPIDPHGETRKPFIGADLRTITVFPKSEVIIAAGSGGLILRSADGGISWQDTVIALTVEEKQRLERLDKLDHRERKADQRPQPEKILPKAEKKIAVSGSAVMGSPVVAGAKDLDKKDGISAVRDTTSPRPKLLPLVPIPKAGEVPETPEQKPQMKK